MAIGHDEEVQDANDYADRFDPMTYESENPTRVWLSSHEPPDGVAIPSPVFYRLIALGYAYNLHILGQVLSWNEEQRLDPNQCQTLLLELDFVESVLDDPLLQDYLPGLRDQVERSARGSDALVLDLDT